MTTSNYNPANATDYINTTWNQEATTLQPQQVTAATITLTITEDTAGLTDFSYTITITGTQT